MQTAIDIVLGKHLKTTVSSEQRKFVEQELAKNVDQYSSINSFNIHVASFNVTGTRPVDQQMDLKKWLLPDINNKADIFIIGFQEIIPISNFYRSNVAEKTYWKEQVTRCFALNAADEKYQFVRELDMGGSYLLFFVRKHVQTRIGDLATAAYKLPISDTGSKGAVAIRMNIDDTSFVFLNCHLDNGTAIANANSRHS
jgi:hypothetical protein